MRAENETASYYSDSEYSSRSASPRTDKLRNDDRNDKKIVAVKNISSIATKEQIKVLFGFLGDIRDIALFSDEKIYENDSQLAYIKFSRSQDVRLAMYLNNVVFADRPLIVELTNLDSIPEPKLAIKELVNLNSSAYVEAPHLSQIVAGQNDAQLIVTNDPRLAASGVPLYPNLPVGTDFARVEEIRRTVYVGNLDSKLTPQEILGFFENIGAVRFLRIAGDINQPTRFAFVEFDHFKSIATALKFNGHSIGARTLKVHHSNNAILKRTVDTSHDEDARKATERSHHSRNRTETSRHTDHDRSRRYERSRRRSKSNDSDRSRHRNRSRSRSRRRERSRSNERRRDKRSSHSRRHDKDSYRHYHRDHHKDDDRSRRRR